MGLAVNQLNNMQKPPSPGQDSGGGKMGQQGVITNTATSAQPSMGVPNQYSNTVGLGDNQQQFLSVLGRGKGV